MHQKIEPYNISEKYKCQWIAPERTGSRKVAEILCFFGFTNTGKSVFSANEHAYTHLVAFDEKYKDYKLICNARNPYAKTVAIFKNIYTPESRNGNKDDFKKFVLEDLKQGKRIDMVQRPILNRKADYTIRLEYMTEDIKKIPFILEKFTDKQIEALCYHERPLFPWEEFYDQETKDAVYGYTSHLFEMWGYEK